MLEHHEALSPNPMEVTIVLRPEDDTIIDLARHRGRRQLAARRGGGRERRSGSLVTLEEGLARRVPKLIQWVHDAKDPEKANRFLEELAHAADLLWKWDVRTPIHLAARAHLVGFYYAAITGDEVVDEAVRKLVVGTFELVNLLSEEDRHV